MIMKRIQFALILLFLLTGPAAVHAGSGEFGTITSITALGFDTLGRYENTRTNPGLSLCQEFYFDIGKTLQGGAGFKYLPPREMAEGEQLSWQPVYGSIKLYIPTSDLPVYLKAAAGYTFVQGNDAFKVGISNLHGGFYYFLGGGLDLPFHYSRSVRISFVFDMGYSSYKAGAKQGTDEVSFSYLTLDVIGGIGLKF